MLRKYALWFIMLFLVSAFAATYFTAQDVPATEPLSSSNIQPASTNISNLPSDYQRWEDMVASFGGRQSFYLNNYATNNVWNGFTQFYNAQNTTVDLNNIRAISNSTDSQGTQIEQYTLNSTIYNGTSIYTIPRASTTFSNLRGNSLWFEDFEQYTDTAMWTTNASYLWSNVAAGSGMSIEITDNPAYIWHGARALRVYGTGDSSVLNATISAIPSSDYLLLTFTAYIDSYSKLFVQIGNSIAMQWKSDTYIYYYDYATTSWKKLQFYISGLTRCDLLIDRAAHTYTIYFDNLKGEIYRSPISPSFVAGNSLTDIGFVFEDSSLALDFCNYAALNASNTINLPIAISNFTGHYTAASAMQWSALRIDGAAGLTFPTSIFDGVQWRAISDAASFTYSSSIYLTNCSTSISLFNSSHFSIFTNQTQLLYVSINASDYATGITVPLCRWVTFSVCWSYETFTLQITCNGTSSLYYTFPATITSNGVKSTYESRFSYINFSASGQYYLTDTLLTAAFYPLPSEIAGLSTAYLVNDPVFGLIRSWTLQEEFEGYADIAALENAGWIVTQQTSTAATIDVNSYSGANSIKLYDNSGTNAVTISHNVPQLTNESSRVTFDDYTIGTTPPDWDHGDNYFYSYDATVVASAGGKTNVLKLDSPFVYPPNDFGCCASNHFTEPRSTGSIEFWLYSDDWSTNHVTVVLISDYMYEICPYLTLDDEGLRAYYASTYHYLSALENSKWYKFILSFDCASQSYSLDVNDTLFSDIEFAEETQNGVLNRFEVWVDNDATCYLDDVMYSWLADAPNIAPLVHIGAYLYADQATGAACFNFTNALGNRYFGIWMGKGNSRWYVSTDNTVIDTGYSYAAATWYKVDVLANLTSESWSFYVNDTILAANLGWYTASDDNIASIAFQTSATYGTTPFSYYIDDLFVESLDATPSGQSLFSSLVETNFDYLSATGENITITGNQTVQLDTFVETTNYNAFETNFDYTNHYLAANVTIAANETVQLSQTGIYNATYSFTNDADGAIPAGWTRSQSANTIGGVISVQDEHSKVLKLEDNTDNGAVSLRNNFVTDQTAGVIEFWFQINATNQLSFSIFNSTGQLLVFLMANYPTLGQFGYCDTAYHAIGTCSNDVWYHILIYFNTTNWYTVINGVKYGDYNFYLNKAPVSGMNYFVVGTNWVEGGYKCWIDAVDYSWTQGYSTNRNMINWYCSNGYYISPAYLINGSQYHYYQTLNFSQDIPNVTVAGQYKGEYSFSSDAVSSNPLGWTTFHDCPVIATLAGHNNVVNISDYYTDSYTCLYQSFSAKTSGSIEFWMYAADTGIAPHMLLIYLLGTGGGDALRLNFTNGNIYDNDGSLLGTSKLSYNTWLHMRIYFNVSAGHLNGYIYMNGIYIGTPSTHITITDISTLRFQFCGTTQSGNFYVDAIDYSWASGYYLNRNKDLDSITIVEGQYKAAYSFASDLVGSDPAGWTVSEPGTSTIRVIANLDGHNKIVEITEKSGASPTLYNTFTGQNTGTIELWWRSASYSEQLVMIYGGVTQMIRFHVYGGQWAVQDGAAHTNLVAFTVNHWYHLQIDWDIATGWQLTIDDTQYGAGYDFDWYATPAAAITKILIYGNSGATKVFYLDAVDYSWNDGYYLNRNMDLIPCLTLQYRTSIDNSTWSSWSAETITNLTINAFNNRYFQFCLNLSTTDISTSPSCNWVNLTYSASEFVYCANGWYQSVIYDLGCDRRYDTLYFSRILGVSDTSLTLKYRDSPDGIGWNSWSDEYTANQTVSDFKDRYFQFYLTLTSSGLYTSQCQWVELNYTFSFWAINMTYAYTSMYSVYSFISLNETFPLCVDAFHAEFSVRAAQTDSILSCILSTPDDPIAVNLSLANDGYWYLASPIGIVIGDTLGSLIPFGPLALSAYSADEWYDLTFSYSRIYDALGFGYGLLFIYLNQQLAGAVIFLSDIAGIYQCSFFTDNTTSGHFDLANFTVWLDGTVTSAVQRNISASNFKIAYTPSAATSNNSLFSTYYSDGESFILSDSKNILLNLSISILSALLTDLSSATLQITARMPYTNASEGFIQLWNQTSQQWILLAVLDAFTTTLTYTFTPSQLTSLLVNDFLVLQFDSGYSFDTTMLAEIQIDCCYIVLDYLTFNSDPSYAIDTYDFGTPILVTGTVSEWDYATTRSPDLLFEVSNDTLSWTSFSQSGGEGGIQLSSPIIARYCRLITTFLATTLQSYVSTFVCGQSTLYSFEDFIFDQQFSHIQDTVFVSYIGTPVATPLDENFDNSVFPPFWIRTVTASTAIDLSPLYFTSTPNSLRLYDDDPAASCSVYTTFSSIYTYTAINFSIFASQIDGTLIMSLCNSTGTPLFRLKMGNDDNHWYVGENLAWTDTGITYAAGTWYTVTCYLSLAERFWYLKINNAVALSNIALWLPDANLNLTVGISEVLFETATSATYAYYLDDVCVQQMFADNAVERSTINFLSAYIFALTSASKFTSVHYYVFCWSNASWVEISSNWTDSDIASLFPMYRYDGMTRWKIHLDNVTVIELPSVNVTTRVLTLSYLHFNWKFHGSDTTQPSSIKSDDFDHYGALTLASNYTLYTGAGTPVLDTAQKHSSPKAAKFPDSSGSAASAIQLIQPFYGTVTLSLWFYQETALGSNITFAGELGAYFGVWLKYDHTVWLTSGSWSQSWLSWTPTTWQHLTLQMDMVNNVGTVTIDSVTSAVSMRWVVRQPTTAQSLTIGTSKTSTGNLWIDDLSLNTVAQGSSYMGKQYAYYLHYWQEDATGTQYTPTVGTANLAWFGSDAVTALQNTTATAYYASSVVKAQASSPVIYRYYTSTGDFLGWTNVNFNQIFNSGTYLRAITTSTIGTYTAKRIFSPTVILNLSCTLNVYLKGGSAGTYQCKLFYTDGTYTPVFSISFTSPHDYYVGGKLFSSSFTSGKPVDYIQISAYNSGGGVLEFWIYDEWYYAAIKEQNTINDIQSNDAVSYVTSTLDCISSTRFVSDYTFNVATRCNPNQMNLFYDFAPSYTGTRTALLSFYQWGSGSPTFQTPVFTNRDDAGYTIGGTWAAASITAGQYSAAKRNAYFCFPLNVPTGSTITTGTLNLYVLSKIGTPALKIYLIDLTDCPAFPIDLSADTETNYPITLTHAISWTPSGTGWQSVDIKQLIQDFIARPNYQEGNYIGIKIDNNNAADGNYISIRPKESTTNTAYLGLTISYTIGTWVSITSFSNKIVGNYTINSASYISTSGSFKLRISSGYTLSTTYSSQLDVNYIRIDDNLACWQTSASNVRSLHTELRFNTTLSALTASNYFGQFLQHVHLEWGITYQKTVSVIPIVKGYLWNFETGSWSDLWTATSTHSVELWRWTTSTTAFSGFFQTDSYFNTLSGRDYISANGTVRCKIAAYPEQTAYTLWVDAAYVEVGMFTGTATNYLVLNGTNVQFAGFKFHSGSDSYSTTSVQVDNISVSLFRSTTELSFSAVGLAFPFELVPNGYSAYFNVTVYNGATNRYLGQWSTPSLFAPVTIHLTRSVTSLIYNVKLIIESHGSEVLADVIVAAFEFGTLVQPDEISLRINGIRPIATGLGSATLLAQFAVRTLNITSNYPARVDLSILGTFTNTTSPPELYDSRTLHYYVEAPFNIEYPTFTLTNFTCSTAYARSGNSAWTLVSVTPYGVHDLYISTAALNAVFTTANALNTSEYIDLILLTNIDIHALVNAPYIQTTPSVTAGANVTYTRALNASTIWQYYYFTEPNTVQSLNLVRRSTGETVPFLYKYSQYYYFNSYDCSSDFYSGEYFDLTYTIAPGWHITSTFLIQNTTFVQLTYAISSDYPVANVTTAISVSSYEHWRIKEGSINVTGSTAIAQTATNLHFFLASTNSTARSFDIKGYRVYYTVQLMAGQTTTFVQYQIDLWNAMSGLFTNAIIRVNTTTDSYLIWKMFEGFVQQPWSIDTSFATYVLITIPNFTATYRTLYLNGYSWRYTQAKVTEIANYAHYRVTVETNDIDAINAIGGGTITVNIINTLDFSVWKVTGSSCTFSFNTSTDVYADHIHINLTHITVSPIYLEVEGYDYGFSSQLISETALKIYYTNTLTLPTSNVMANFTTIYTVIPDAVNYLYWTLSAPTLGGGTIFLHNQSGWVFNVYADRVEITIPSLQSCLALNLISTFPNFITFKIMGYDFIVNAPTLVSTTTTTTIYNVKIETDDLHTIGAGTLIRVQITRDQRWSPVELYLNNINVTSTFNFIVEDLHFVHWTINNINSTVTIFQIRLYTYNVAQLLKQDTDLLVEYGITISVGHPRVISNTTLEIDIKAINSIPFRVWELWYGTQNLTATFQLTAYVDHLELIIPNFTLSFRTYTLYGYGHSVYITLTQSIDLEEIYQVKVRTLHPRSVINETIQVGITNMQAYQYWIVTLNNNSISFTTTSNSILFLISNMSVGELTYIVHGYSWRSYIYLFNNIEQSATYKVEITVLHDLNLTDKPREIGVNIENYYSRIVWEITLGGFVINITHFSSTTLFFDLPILVNDTVSGLNPDSTFIVTGYSYRVSQVLLTNNELLEQYRVTIEYDRELYNISVLWNLIPCTILDKGSSQKWYWEVTIGATLYTQSGSYPSQIKWLIVNLTGTSMIFTVSGYGARITPATAADDPNAFIEETGSLLVYRVTVEVLKIEALNATLINQPSRFIDIRFSSTNIAMFPTWRFFANDIEIAYLLNYSTPYKQKVSIIAGFNFNMSNTLFSFYIPYVNATSTSYELIGYRNEIALELTPIQALEYEFEITISTSDLTTLETLLRVTQDTRAGYTTKISDVRYTLYWELWWNNTIVSDSFGLQVYATYAEFHPFNLSLTAYQGQYSTVFYLYAYKLDYDYRFTYLNQTYMTYELVIRTANNNTVNHPFKYQPAIAVPQLFLDPDLVSGNSIYLTAQGLRIQIDDAEHSFSQMSIWQFYLGTPSENHTLWMTYGAEVMTLTIPYLNLTGDITYYLRGYKFYLTYTLLNCTPQVGAVQINIQSMWNFASYSVNKELVFGENNQFNFTDLYRLYSLYFANLTKLTDLMDYSLLHLNQFAYTFPAQGIYTLYGYNWLVLTQLLWRNATYMQTQLTILSVHNFANYTINQPLVFDSINVGNYQLYATYFVNGTMREFNITINRAANLFTTDLPTKGIYYLCGYSWIHDRTFMNVNNATYNVIDITLESLLEFGSYYWIQDPYAPNSNVSIAAYREYDLWGPNIQFLTLLSAHLSTTQNITIFAGDLLLLNFTIPNAALWYQLFANGTIVQQGRYYNQSIYYYANSQISTLYRLEYGASWVQVNVTVLNHWSFDIYTQSGYLSQLNATYLNQPFTIQWLLHGTGYYRLFRNNTLIIASTPFIDLESAVWVSLSEHTAAGTYVYRFEIDYGSGYTTNHTLSVVVSSKPAFALYKNSLEFYRRVDNTFAILLPYRGTWSLRSYDWILDKVMFVQRADYFRLDFTIIACHDFLRTPYYDFNQPLQFDLTRLQGTVHYDISGYITYTLSNYSILMNMLSITSNALYIRVTDRTGNYSICGYYYTYSWSIIDYDISRYLEIRLDVQSTINIGTIYFDLDLSSQLVTIDYWQIAFWSNSTSLLNTNIHRLGYHLLFNFSVFETQTYRIRGYGVLAAITLPNIYFNNVTHFGARLIVNAVNQSAPMDIVLNLAPFLTRAHESWGITINGIKWTNITVTHLGSSLYQFTLPFTYPSNIYAIYGFSDYWVIEFRSTTVVQIKYLVNTFNGLSNSTRYLDLSTVGGITSPVWELYFRDNGTKYQDIIDFSDDYLRFSITIPSSASFSQGRYTIYGKLFSSIATVIEDSGTYTNLTYQIITSFPLTDATLILDLTSIGIDHELKMSYWTVSFANGTFYVNATEYALNRIRFVLTQTLTSQTWIIQGFAPIPFATIYDYAAEAHYYIVINNTMTVRGYLSFPKTSRYWFLTIDPSWECYYITYGNTTYDVQLINATLLYFDGWANPTVQTAYLSFEANCILNVTEQFIDSTTYYITITTSIPLDGLVLVTDNLNLDDRRVIYLVNSSISLLKILENEVYYLYNIDLKAGINIIILKADPPAPNAMYSGISIAVAIIGVIIVGFWWWRRRNRTPQTLKKGGKSTLGESKQFLSKIGKNISPSHVYGTVKSGTSSGVHKLRNLFSRKKKEQKQEQKQKK